MTGFRPATANWRCALLAALPRHDLPISVEAPSDRLRARHGDAAFARLLRRGVSRLLADMPAGPRSA
jgi:hypothetical protein